MEILGAVVVYFAVAGLVGFTLMEYGHGRIPGVHRDNNGLWLGIGIFSLPLTYLVWNNGWLAFGILVLVAVVVRGISAGGWFDKNRGRPTNP